MRKLALISTVFLVAFTASGASKNVQALQAQLESARADAQEKAGRLAVTQAALAQAERDKVALRKMAAGVAKVSNLNTRKSFESSLDSVKTADMAATQTREIKDSVEKNTQGVLQAKEAADSARATAAGLTQTQLATLVAALAALLSGAAAWLNTSRIAKTQEDTRQIVYRIEINGNSKMDALLKKTEEAALAKGASDERTRADGAARGV